ncbi:MAG TPA: aminomethyl-transferring glycine dehydrogenase [Gemmatimonadota bacterium]|nr:aminomethyl-transferring glycine dehydrogenase [Gemmatimonadota bacterium]
MPQSVSPPDRFVDRHIGPRPEDVQAMLATLGQESLEGLVDAVVPEGIRLRRRLDLPPAVPEEAVLAELADIAAKNQVWRTWIGMGYHDCVTPPVILRNVIENPGWYTAYTPYQAEIAQGRLEALLVFQSVVADLTGLPVANASLLDEGTAAAEALAMFQRVTRKDDGVFLVDRGCHPQTIAVVRTRAEARGSRVEVAQVLEREIDGQTAGVLLQYPTTEGAIEAYGELCERVHAVGGLVAVATDLLALTLLEPPGSWGADVAVGNSQRFGVPLGYGGPHAAFFATREAHARQVPGRIVGVTRDSSGREAYRMALQTREQHIRKEKATSNVCTSQVLLAVVAGMYAVYHGPEGLTRIARRVHGLTCLLAAGLERLGRRLSQGDFFDTLAVELDPGEARRLHEAAAERRINLRPLSGSRIGVAFDETVTETDVRELIEVFAAGGETPFSPGDPADAGAAGNGVRGIPAALARTAPFLEHPVFHRYRSETEMLRYLKRLENRDLSLAHAMIPLGSCTMKLNATTEMIPITWPGFARLHPFAPPEQAAGYAELFEQLERWLAEITGFARVSLQPNAGSQGEFAGLLVIRAWHRSRGEEGRTTCLIPQSAHGTNPASAVMAGMDVVVVKTDASGNIDVDDLRAKAAQHADNLGTIMVTYPSTHGVFEARIQEVCDVVHEHGGQVYIDGANMNAQVGLARPGDYGADVCHLNLHKTFCIPHGGGGPGMGPIGVAEHLEPFLPDHPVVELGHERSEGTISAAPWGSPSILPISWAYIRLMGPDGLTRASQVAILNANYVARRLADDYPLLYSGADGLVAHECILDPRPLRQSAGVEVEDIAKRLIDYGFHAPTVSFPVAGTLMVEPTESESKEELDRFIEAMAAIRDEIREIESGIADHDDNLLKNAPHTLAVLTADEWAHPYSRERAAFPTPASADHKVWPAVGRVDAAYGDRNLVCTCPPIEEYASAEA